MQKNECACGVPFNKPGMNKGLNAVSTKIIW